ncbi:unnamed protein product [[Candida] boidinii]|uniref:Unnamed protein product n=1 Tax=Candida boidinii TaxID=5477 RepID=A0A9W6WFP8_CANBO|nr:hypothetical protein B5S30_g566 [[Candida] boidinii]OWB83044.1 hypothetical protein B5S33_g1673 [[Candida] boidinii]GME69012.1 unnamed protein product [[Candida] boidinii]GMF99339.1 unnamed protein product [[Candida] boidinii]
MFESYSQDTKINSVSLVKHQNDQVTRSVNSPTSTNTSTSSSNFGSNLTTRLPLKNNAKSEKLNSNTDNMSIEFDNGTTLSQKDKLDGVPSNNSSLPPVENHKEIEKDQGLEKRQSNVTTPANLHYEQHQQHQQRQQNQQESSLSSESQSQSQSSVDSPSSTSSLPFSNTVQHQRDIRENHSEQSSIPSPPISITIKQSNMKNGMTNNDSNQRTAKLPVKQNLSTNTNTNKNDVKVKTEDSVNKRVPDYYAITNAIKLNNNVLTDNSNNNKNNNNKININIYNSSTNNSANRNSIRSDTGDNVADTSDDDEDQITEINQDLVDFISKIDQVIEVTRNLGAPKDTTETITQTLSKAKIELYRLNLNKNLVKRQLKANDEEYSIERQLLSKNLENLEKHIHFLANENNISNNKNKKLLNYCKTLKHEKLKSLRVENNNLKMEINDLQDHILKLNEENNNSSNNISGSVSSTSSPTSSSATSSKFASSHGSGVISEGSTSTLENPSKKRKSKSDPDTTIIISSNINNNKTLSPNISQLTSPISSTAALNISATPTFAVTTPTTNPLSPNTNMLETLGRLASHVLEEEHFMESHSPK